MKYHLQPWAFCCLLFLTINPFVHAQVFSSNANARPAIVFDPAILYDQKELLYSDEYKKASDVEKENLREAHFRKIKSQISDERFNTKAMWVVGNLLGQVGIFWLLQKHKLDLGQSAWLTNGAIGMALGNMLYQSTNELSQEMSMSRFDPLEADEINYVRKKPFFSKPMRKLIEENFVAARHSSELDRHLSFAKVAINMPIEIKPASHVDQKAFKEKFSSQNNEETFKGINQWTHGYLRRLSNPNFPRYAAYFYGTSRTGKTKAAEWIADFLSLPFEKINLGGKTVQDLFGTGKNSANPGPGLLIKALVNAKRSGKNAKNIIILLDEADRLINRNQDGGSNDWLTQFLTLLDPNTKSFYSEYLETDIDISLVGFILTGNNELIDTAFKKRLHEVPFDGYTKAYKENIIWSDWIPNLLDKQNSACQLNMDDFHKENITQMLDEDEDVGFRSIEWKLGQYFLEKDAEKCGWGH